MNSSKLIIRLFYHFNFTLSRLKPGKPEKLGKAGKAGFSEVTDFTVVSVFPDFVIDKN